MLVLVLIQIEINSIIVTPNQKLSAASRGLSAVRERHPAVREQLLLVQDRAVDASRGRRRHSAVVDQRRLP